MCSQPLPPKDLGILSCQTAKCRTLLFGSVVKHVCQQVEWSHAQTPTLPTPINSNDTLDVCILRGGSVGIPLAKNESFFERPRFCNGALTFGYDCDSGQVSMFRRWTLRELRQGRAGGRGLCANWPEDEGAVPIYRWLRQGGLSRLQHDCRRRTEPRHCFSAAYGLVWGHRLLSRAAAQIQERDAL